MERIVIIGLGLIGGSMGLSLRKKDDRFVTGVDHNSTHAEKALELGIIDQIGNFDSVKTADLVIIAVPVDAIPDLIEKVLNSIESKTTVIDLGSVKESVCERVKDHEKRSNFVAAHPIAGTEFSGPEAAITGLFTQKMNVICEPDRSHFDHLNKAIELFQELEMKVRFMHAKEHDKHIAYVSHLSHISSFMLGKTVLEIEPDEAAIFTMAGSGFESTVRLAKSSPEMWAPIFMQNKKNVLKSLEEYIKNLEQFKLLIEQSEKENIYQIMEQTNRIKNILNGITK